MLSSLELALKVPFRRSPGSISFSALTFLICLWQKDACSFARKAGCEPSLSLVVSDAAELPVVTSCGEWGGGSRGAAACPLVVLTGFVFTRLLEKEHLFCSKNIQLERLETVSSCYPSELFLLESGHLLAFCDCDGHASQVCPGQCLPCFSPPPTGVGLFTLRR